MISIFLRSAMNSAGDRATIRRKTRSSASVALSLSLASTEIAVRACVPAACQMCFLITLNPLLVPDCIAEESVHQCRPCPLPPSVVALVILGVASFRS